MFCFIYKRLISRYLDMGNSRGEMPAFVARHVRRCDTCRKFHRLSQSLGRRLVADRSRFLRGSKNVDSLNEKIISALVTTPVPTPRRRPVGGRFRLPVPVMAAALVVLVVTLGIIFQVGVRAPGAGEDMAIGLEAIDFNKISLPEIVGRVESPIEAEMNSLKQSMKSAAEFISSVVDVELGPQ